MEVDAASTKGPSAETLTAIKAAIANASTLEEVQRLENALKTGIVPSAVQVQSLCLCLIIIGDASACISNLTHHLPVCLACFVYLVPCTH